MSVRINNRPAYVQYVSATQVNVLAPCDTSRGSEAVALTNAAGTATANAALAAVLPGCSVLSGFVRAVRSDGAIINGTGTAETGFRVSAAVGPGGVLSLYGTGFGATTTEVADGLVFSGAYPTANPVTVTIGGVAATVLWAGLVGPGLYQTNVTVPAALADGDHAVVASVSGVSSQTGASLKLAAAAKLTASTGTARREWLARGPRHHSKAVTKRMLAGVLGAKPQGEVEDCLVVMA